MCSNLHSCQFGSEASLETSLEKKTTIAAVDRGMIVVPL